MSALLAVALITQSIPAVPAETLEDEVVVIGNKLKAWRARVRKVDGQMRCAIVKSTGDRDVDLVGCNAMATCATQLEPQLQAVADRKLSRAARRTAQTQAESRLLPCMMNERTRLIEELAERRYQVSR